ncbi:protein lines [Armigeres subalbatus]|uniref:protein lines n=1 Tax=Armigeres subalbatus TaxID=124917 RepID=UPI002ED113C8
MVLQNEKELKKGLGPSLGPGPPPAAVVTDSGTTPSPTIAVTDVSIMSPPSTPHLSSSSTSSSSSLSSSIRNNNGQPVIKRQRIEKASDVVDSSNSTSSTAAAVAALVNCAASSSGNSSNGSSLGASACSSSTSLSSSPPTASSSSSVLSGSSSKILDVSNGSTSSSSSGIGAEDMLLKQVHDYQALFQGAIAKQCLCGLETEVLLMSLQSYYVCSGSSSQGIQRQLLPMIEWPFEYLLKFLSNVQLLFDTYLKQNIKGNICSGVMDLCNYLVRSEHLHPDGEFVGMNIDEIIGLCNYNNKFINYLSGRILSSFLIIVKDDLYDRWLEKIVANLFDFNQLDILAVKKVNFSLDVIQRIVEWKDETEHPLDDYIQGQEASSSDAGPSSAMGYDHHQPHYHQVPAPPPLENNYFATHYGSQQYGSDTGASSIFSPSTSSSSSVHPVPVHHSSSLSHPSAAHHPSLSSSGGLLCHIINLTDSESFDTTSIKCETVNKLGKKWPALVEVVSRMIKALSGSQSQNPQSLTAIATETCILTFLRLWESIISVKANLSVVETQPFHAQLDHFQLLLLSTKNSVIYKQMLTLFNEALCYGSTLALQDFIPDEVGSLAHNVVRCVKDHRILDKMPKSTYTSPLGFIGYKGSMIRYHDNRLSPVTDQNGRVPSGDELAGGSSGTSDSASASNSVVTCGYDRTLMQKMALLVLKAVAVIVKEIRCDSSDSSVDSSDFDMQEIQMIERSIRDVVRKLETFLKNRLEFHPDNHFSKVLIHLFDDQDDYLVEAMVCTLDVTSGISFRNNAFPELIAILNPVYTFIEFSNLGPNITHLFLDLLISTETCFLLYLLRFLKYIRQNWSMFMQSCLTYSQHNNYSNASTLLQSVRNTNIVINPNSNNVILDSVMTVLISLRLQISRQVADAIFPYNIGPILRLIENCESLYEGNELS